MNCTNCQHEIAPNSNFCNLCGARQAPVYPTGSAPWNGKRLMRSSTNVKIAGVCGGFAEYFGWDPTLVRLLWVILSIMPVPAIPSVIAYIVCWCVMPVAPLPEAVKIEPPSNVTHTPQTA